VPRAPVAALLALAACTAAGAFYVAGSTGRGPYLDATLAASDGEWRLLFPSTPECAALLRPGTWLDYSSAGGGFGRVQGPEGSACAPLGAGTLQRWRRTRRPGDLAPTSTARWTLLHEDPEVILLRGRFALVSRLGVANGFDVVVMVPNDEVCAEVAHSGEATLLFRTSGQPVLELGRCPVLAVAAPP
jgi:hypothetical protein